MGRLTELCEKAIKHGMFYFRRHEAEQIQILAEEHAQLSEAVKDAIEALDANHLWHQVNHECGTETEDCESYCDSELEDINMHTLIKLKRVISRNALVFHPALDPNAGLPHDEDCECEKCLKAVRERVADMAERRS